MGCIYLITIFMLLCKSSLQLLGFTANMNWTTSVLLYVSVIFFFFFFTFTIILFLRKTLICNILVKLYFLINNVQSEFIEKKEEDKCIQYKSHAHIYTTSVYFYIAPLSVWFFNIYHDFIIHLSRIFLIAASLPWIINNFLNQFPTELQPLLFSLFLPNIKK